MALRRCVHLDTKDARLSRYRSYNCTAPTPETPILPASVTGYGFQWPPHRSRVCVDFHCQKCPMYVAAKPPTQEPTP